MSSRPNPKNIRFPVGKLQKTDLSKIYSRPMTAMEKTASIGKFEIESSMKSSVKKSTYLQRLEERKHRAFDL